jgi:hypothetical protein
MLRLFAYRQIDLLSSVLLRFSITGKKRGGGRQDFLSLLAYLANEKFGVIFKIDRLWCWGLPVRVWRESPLSTLAIWHQKKTGFWGALLLPWSGPLDPQGCCFPWLVGGVGWSGGGREGGPGGRRQKTLWKLLRRSCNPPARHGT